MEQLSTVSENTHDPHHLDHRMLNFWRGLLGPRLLFYCILVFGPFAAIFLGGKMYRVEPSMVLNLTLGHLAAVSGGGRNTT